MSSLRTACRLLYLIVLVAVVGCGSNTENPTAPGVEPEVMNNPDAFEFQVSAVDGYSGVLDYSWTNTGTMAKVDQSCAVEPGQAFVTLLDSAGEDVYTQDLSVDGSYPTLEGAAGDWTVRVQFAATVGTLNFRVEKATP